ncbi:MAG: chitobiase/beta-hexosaminidase C-terminal domain-containing protein, partial [Cyclobacteriaceae bacterium]|nr:chitobiase/beta-hexosaminidase C-terminal domain-containing protein [Cyclobacteriaceae bacterium]
GQLVFKMGDAPNKEWGHSIKSRPKTEKLLPFVVLPYAVTSDENFLHTGKVVLKCEDKQAKIYYTTDGSEPTEKSSIYQKPITIHKTTLVRFVAFKEGILPSVPVSIKMNKLEFEPFTNFENIFDFSPGLEYKYYHAHVMDEFALDELEPVETGIISRFTADERKREDYFGYSFSGFLKIPRDGIYTIYAKTNDGSTLFLDGKKFMTQGHRSIAIRKGKYKIAQKYFQLGNKKFDYVSWEGPGIEKQEIPPGALFHKN